VKRRRVAINLSVFGAVFILMVYWAVHQIVSVDAVDRPYSIAAEFPNAVGVLKNAEVTYLGVNAGVVTSVKRDPAQKAVRISMKMKHDSKIPLHSSANIFRKSAIGEQYIDFEPPTGYSGTAGPFIQQGDRIPITETTIPLEFSELLRSASGLIDSINPDDAGTLVHEAAVGLNGRTDSLRQLTQAGDQLSTTFAARTPALDRLATNGTSLTHVVAEHRGALGQSLTDLHQVADALRNAKGDTALLLDRGSQLLTQAGDLVASQKKNLDCDLKILEVLTDETSTPRRQQELSALLTIGPTAFNGVWDTRDVEPDGVWVRVGFVANTNNPAPQFVPPKSAPPTKPVPGCQSPLQPVPLAADYVIPSGGGTGGGAGPTGAALALTVLAGLAIVRTAGSSVPTKAGQQPVPSMP